MEVEVKETKKRKVEEEEEKEEKEEQESEKEEEEEALRSGYQGLLLARRLRTSKSGPRCVRAESKS